MRTRPRILSLLDATILVLVFGFAANPRLAIAQVSAGSISGQVRVAPGTPLSHPILVSLKGRGVLVNESYTDQEGHFFFTGLPGNIYHVVIEEEGYQPVNEQAAIDPDSTPTRFLTIYLVPRKGNKPIDSTVAGENPNLTSEAEYGKLYPSQAVKEFKEGLKADQKHRIGEAILHYENAIALAPTFYAARNNLGTLRLGQREYDEAQKQFEQVIEFNPNSGSAYFNLANVYLLRNRLHEAERCVEQGLIRYPNSAFGHFLRGSLYSLNGASQRAEASLRRALELDPGMAQAHLALVNMYLLERRSNDAIAELRVFLKGFPHHDFAPKAREVLLRLEMAEKATN